MKFKSIGLFRVPKFGKTANISFFFFCIKETGHQKRRFKFSIETNVLVNVTSFDRPIIRIEVVLLGDTDRLAILYAGELPVVPLLRFIGHNSQVQCVEVIHGSPGKACVVNGQSVQFGSTNLDAAVVYLVQYPVVLRHLLPFSCTETSGQADEE